MPTLAAEFFYIMTLERKLEMAQGYMELGLSDEALKELDALSPEERMSEGALQLRLLILMRDHAWEKGLKVSETLRKNLPQLSTGYIHGAFCLHELGRTREARDILLAGPSTLLCEATYFYNLGCYDAVLGNTEEALKNLKTSFKMNAIFRDIAIHDPDLKQISEFLQ